MHWKILRDPYLHALARHRGEAAVWASGFFLDDDPDDAPLDDIDLRCTPSPKLPIRGEHPVVALLTGALCPVHEGHLATLLRAREALTSAGFDVVGAYLSPGHDQYVQKKCGAMALPASERLRLCGEAAARTDWVSVDPWEALYRRVAVNFTDVVTRLRAYLRAHVDPRMEVAYVCGGDNARFALAFAVHGCCVVVGRPGAAEAFDHWRRTLHGNRNVLWAEGDHPAASRALRSAPWRPPHRPRLVLRLEDQRAIATLRRVDFARFQHTLVALLAQHTELRLVRSSPVSLPDTVISLDPMATGGHPLAISRLYALGGYEALGHVARPDTAPLEAQRHAIPPGAYILHDDDRASGSTLGFARQLLHNHVEILRESVAVTLDADEDLADSRDFLLGTDHGGLVVRLTDGAIGRAPYLLPYVDPAVRCSIAPADVHTFSRRVWELNADLFEGTGLCVRDLPPPAQRTMAWMGHDRPLTEVCRWHVNSLRRTAFDAPTLP